MAWDITIKVHSQSQSIDLMQSDAGDDKKFIR